jgi:hypothetical protein
MASTPTTGPAATGNKIGSIISAAFDTAFPIFGKIMDLFKNSDRTRKADAQKALDEAKAQFEATVKKNIQPAATVAKELAVIEIFATAAVKANDSIVRMEEILQQDSPDFAEIDVNWTIVKKSLERANAVKPEDIQVIAEAVIQLRLIDLQDSRNELMVRIDNNIAKGKAGKLTKKSDLQTQVAGMAALLKGLNSLAAIEFGFLKADIDKLVKWAGGNPAGGTPKADAELMNIAETNIKLGQSAVESTAA